MTLDKLIAQLTALSDKGCGAKMDGGDNIMNTNPECFTPEGKNPYPLCTGKDMPECENCQLRAGWNGGDTDE